MLPLGGLELILGPASGVAVAGAECSLFPWRPPLLLNGYRDSKEKIPGSNPCGRGGGKNALYRCESMGGTFLYARGRTASDTRPGQQLEMFASIYQHSENKASKSARAGHQRNH
eukprot:1162075-Pelagomonas_calceolata.AAC.2